MEFVDVEQLGREFLRSVLSETVVLRVPDPRPVRFLQVMRTGGSAVNRVLERAQLTVRGWGGHDLEAKRLAASARHAFFHEGHRLRLVRGVEEVQGLQSNPDPDSGQARWEFTVQLMVRASR